MSNCVQRTGHDLHVLYVSELTHRMHAAGIPFHDIVVDFHDQIIRAVPEEFGTRTIELDAEVTAWLNDYVGLTVRLKGKPKLCSNLADAKEVAT